MPLDIKKYGIVKKKKKKLDWLKILQIKMLYLALTNFRLYNRWVKIQHIKYQKNIIKQNIDAKEQAYLRQKRIKNFKLRKKPQLLKFYKKLKKIENIIYKIINFLIKFVLIILGLIIIFVLLSWFFEWARENPLWVIIFLLIMILLK